MGLPKKKPKATKPREYIDPRLAKATVILRDFLNSFRVPQPTQ